MTTLLPSPEPSAPVSTAPAPRSVPAGSHRPVGRLVLGLFVVATGVGWLLDQLGVAVPWRVFPTVGLIVVGLALMVARPSRGALVGFGLALLAASLVAAGTPARFVGPVGDRTVRPAPVDWPVESQLSVGTLTVDLTGRALPRDGLLKAGVGVGQIELVLPRGVPVWVDTDVGMGGITVDGRTVDDGIRPRWSDNESMPGAARVEARVGLGSVEVRHE